MKRQFRLGSHMISGLFVFLLIGVFAITSLTLTLIGTRVYQRVANEASQNSDSRLALNYLASKLRTFDEAGCVSLETRDGLSVLCLRETYGDQLYETSVYLYDGQICERFALSDGEFDPKEGSPLMAASALHFSALSSQLLETRVTLENGETRSLCTALRTGFKEVP